MIGRASPLTLLALALIALPVHAASDPPEAPAAPPCVVKGTLLESATIFDAAKSGQPVVEITGSARWVQVSEFSPRAQRLRLVSATSTPSLRVEGFVDVNAMPIGVLRDVSIAGSVLALRATVPLRVTQVNDAIVAEPRAPTFEGTEAPVACADLHVTLEKSPPVLPPSPSALVPIHKAVDLFGAPGGAPIMTLKTVGTSASVTFNGYETSNGYVHVRYAADVVIDGWMRRSELTEKLSISSCCGGATCGLGMWGTSSSASFAQRDSEVRLSGEQGPHVGVLEKGARVARWGTGSGAWTQIRIYDADANEPAGKAFYVRENDLGATPP